MTKAELIARVAKEAKISKAAAPQAIDSITDTIAGELKRGERISLPGFSTFSVAKLKARTGRNPRTGEKIIMPPGNTAQLQSL